MKRALEKCELVVVSDICADTDTTAYADILLPALGWGEKMELLLTLSVVFHVNVLFTCAG